MKPHFDKDGRYQDAFERGATSALPLQADFKEHGKGTIDFQMEKIAAQLSAFTGVKIEWHNVPDSCCNCYGDMGYFWMVKPKKPDWAD